MALIDHIRACNAWDPARFAPLWRGSDRIGRVAVDRLPTLSASPDFFEDDARGGLALKTPSGDPDQDGAAFDAVFRPHFASLPDVGGWRGEKLDVAPRWGAPVALRVERCLVPVLGAKAYGVHVNAFVPTADGPAIWTARRAKTLGSFPGQLDHMVAGGIATGYGPSETVVKEADEEAGVSNALARRARAVGVVSYTVAMSGGLREDTLFCYDLEVPNDFTPRPVDGEVEGFDLRPAAAVVDALRDGGGYKFNVPLVLIDFAIRHGLLTPESEPDYAALCAGLRGGAI